MHRNYVLCNTLSRQLKIKTVFDWYICWRFAFGAVWKKQLYKEEEDEHSRGIYRWHLSNSKVISETTGYGDVFQICRIEWKILWKVLLLHFQKEVQELINSMKSSLFWILRLLIFSCSSWQISHFYSTGVLINIVLCVLIFMDFSLTYWHGFSYSFYYATWTHLWFFSLSSSWQEKLQLSECRFPEKSSPIRLWR